MTAAYDKGRRDAQAFMAAGKHKTREPIPDPAVSPDAQEDYDAGWNSVAAKHNAQSPDPVLASYSQMARDKPIAFAAYERECNANQISPWPEPVKLVNDDPAQTDPAYLVASAAAAGTRLALLRKYGLLSPLPGLGGGPSS